LQPVRRVSYGCIHLRAAPQPGCTAGPDSKRPAAPSAAGPHATLLSGATRSLEFALRPPWSV